MGKIRHHVLLCLRFFVLLLFGIALVGVLSEDSFAADLKKRKNTRTAERFAIIVNKSNNTDNVSFRELVKYFCAKKRRWPNGKPVVILLRETGSDEKKVLLEKIYKLSEKELRKMWVGKVYRGQMTSPPQVKNSASTIIRSVSAKEGGIGIVKLKDITKDIKVLKIDGRLPTDEGFPFTVE